MRTLITPLVSSNSSSSISYRYNPTVTYIINLFVLDASYGYLSLIPNLLSNYGWNPGNKFLNYLGTVLASKTNNPDITFAEVKSENNEELMIIKMNIFIIY